jgi:hypothetical protein
MAKTTYQQQAIVSAQVSASDKEQLDRMAADADRTLSAEIRRVLRRHLADVRSTTTHRKGSARGSERGQRRPTGEANLQATRVKATRQNAKWVEIDDDLVPRGPFLVSASSDLVYKLHTGIVFEPGSAAMIADQAALHWYGRRRTRLRRATAGNLDGAVREAGAPRRAS